MDNDVKDIMSRRHIGRNIQKIRVYLGMKQEALAADLGVSQNIISKIEKEPEIEEGLLNQLASALGISAEIAACEPLYKSSTRAKLLGSPTSMALAIVAIDGRGLYLPVCRY